MIGYIKGKIIQKTEKSILIGDNGIGYEVNCANQKGAVGDEIELYVYHHFSQDSQKLYGFSDLAQKELFTTLLKVNGLGPKHGLAIITALGKENLFEAVKTGDISAFAHLKGVGQKLAAKIIIELKGRIGEIGNLDLNGIEQANELQEGLKTLGFADKEIIAIIRKMPSSIRKLSFEEQIKWCLKSI